MFAAAFPFFFASKVDKWYLGCANAIAGGMMLAASIGLVYEGVTVDLKVGDVAQEVRLGFILSYYFILQLLVWFPTLPRDTSLTPL